MTDQVAVVLWQKLAAVERSYLVRRRDRVLIIAADHLNLLDAASNFAVVLV